MTYDMILAKGAKMNYASAMQSVLRLDETIYPAILASEQTTRYCMVNVLVFGVLHAVFSLSFSDALMIDAQMTESIPFISKSIFVLIGIAVAFFMHLGGGLFLWVFSRGVGGNTAFLPVYFNLGISFIGLWPLAPFLAAAQAGYSGGGTSVLLGLTAGYGLAVIFFGTKSASGLSLTRMSIAMGLAIIFVASFLYLWV